MRHCGPRPTRDVADKSAGTSMAREEAMTTNEHNRRGAMAVMAGLTATAAATDAIGSAQAQAAPRTFVLVHGSWHGGWCWSRVARILRKHGHEVYAPTLTGLGERSHLMSGLITLDTHITDVVSVIKWENLDNIVLVGHSYAGFVISGDAERASSAISSIVFLDAFLPENGQRVVDLSPPELRATSLAAAAKNEVSRPVPPARAFGVNEKDQAWVDSKTTPQPTLVSMQPIVLTGAREKIGKKAYIRATSYPNPRFDEH